MKWVVDASFAPELQNPKLKVFQLAFRARKPGSSDAFPPDSDPNKLVMALDVWKRAVHKVKPHYAFIDNYPYFKKFLDEDPRSRCWAVTIYGPALVKKIGRDKLLNCQAWHKEELPWGGIWVQLSPHPLTVKPQWRQTVQKELGLASLFGGKAKA